MKEAIVRKDAYYDSVFLMLISTNVRKLSGINEAVVAMGTEMNRNLLAAMGLSEPEVASATANDLIIAVEADGEDALSSARIKVDELLRQKSVTDDRADYRPATLAAAGRAAPDANLAIVSLPGRFAAHEARKALRSGLHVMLFSDNVSLADEVSLKQLAGEKGLLMMGPDCGTAIINGHPICFANAVPRGPIGIVAASGTGLQEVSCVIARSGSGVSQALGTGGRDIREPEVGGMMMVRCIEALGADAKTRVIVVVSKPPNPSLTPRVIRALKRTGKPSVVHFVGSYEPLCADGAIRYAGNLTDAARFAVALADATSTERSGLSSAFVASGAEANTAGARPSEAGGFDLPDAEIEQIVAKERRGIAPHQKYVRGLYTGGTLADEAVAVLSRGIEDVYSCDASDPALRLRDPRVSQRHTVVDLGDDTFTVGRPHPMIDPSIRTDRLNREAGDPEVAVLLLDCVIGYGSHPDPAGAMLESVSRARTMARERGGYLAVIASVTGTDGDPQGLWRQQATLSAAECIVMPTNYQAALLARRLMERLMEGRL